MSKCTECAHCFLNEVWGDYKCNVRQTYIYSMEKHADCEDFRPKEKKNENSSNSND